MVFEFYEKPGCAGNARQKAKLQELGHMLVVKDLLNHKWTKEELRGFFEGKPVSSWFNMTAPEVKNGAIETDKLSAEDALERMIKSPILIKRPLLKSGDKKMSGFDKEELKAMFGVEIDTQPSLCQADDKCTKGE